MHVTCTAGLNTSRTKPCRLALSKSFCASQRGQRKANTCSEHAYLGGSPRYHGDVTPRCYPEMLPCRCYSEMTRSNPNRGSVGSQGSHKGAPLTHSPWWQKRQTVSNFDHHKEGGSPPSGCHGNSYCTVVPSPKCQVRNEVHHPSLH